MPRQIVARSYAPEHLSSPPPSPTRRPSARAAAAAPRRWGRPRCVRLGLTALLAPALGVAGLVGVSTPAAALAPVQAAPTGDPAAGVTPAGVTAAGVSAAGVTGAASAGVSAAGVTGAASAGAGVAPMSTSRPATQRFGDAGHMTGATLSGPAVGLARTVDGRGYWVVDADGRVVPRGDARALGGVRRHLDSAVVGMAATPSGAGYWLVTKAGQVVASGDARAFGSLRGRSVPSPIVGIAAAVRGYYLAAADGRVYAFGTPAGRRTGVPGTKSVVAIASTADSRGYWLVGAGGGVVTYGDAVDRGSLRDRVASPTRSVVAIAPLPDGRGYWMATAAGFVYGFGTAAGHGSTGPDPAGRRTVGLLSDADGGGYWELSAVVSPPVVAISQVVGKPLGTFSVTCYTGGGTTASGAPTGLDDVAVDPSVIPLGSRIIISGVGERTALDTGGAIIGNRLDIWEPTLTQCVDWGRQDRQVWLEP